VRHRYAGCSGCDLLPPLELVAVDELKDGGINIRWHMVENRVPVGGGTHLVHPDGPWGWRINVYVEQTGEHISGQTSVPIQPGQFITNEFLYPGSTNNVLRKGSAR
jgi:hypothetical protein